MGVVRRRPPMCLRSTTCTCPRLLRPWPPAGDGRPEVGSAEIRHTEFDETLFRFGGDLLPLLDTGAIAHDCVSGELVDDVADTLGVREAVHVGPSGVDLVVNLSVIFGDLSVVFSPIGVRPDGSGYAHQTSTRWGRCGTAAAVREASIVAFYVYR